MEPEKAPEAISKAVASLPPEQMFELMKQMKVITETSNLLTFVKNFAYQFGVEGKIILFCTEKWGKELFCFLLIII